MANESFRIPYPESKSEQKRWSKEYGLNAYYAGKHWSIRKRDAEYWHWLTRVAMDEQNVRQVPFKRPVTVTILWNDRLDIDNHAAMGKMIVDAMKGRVIEDDNRRWLRGVSYFFHDQDYISVSIKEVSR